VVKFLQAPTFSIYVWTMVSEVLDMIDKRTGLTELVYGLTGRQMRSATEADVRGENISIRPDDMAEKTEDWYSASNMRETQAAVWLLEEKDLLPVLGPAATQVFTQYAQTQDFEAVARDYNYRIAAGSARKPNKNSKQRSLNEFAQVAMPVIQAFAEQGQVGPFNAFVQDWADTLDLDASRYLLPEPDPQQEGPSPEELQVQMEQMKIQVEQFKIQMDAEKHEQEMDQDQEVHEQELEQAEEKAKLELQLARRKVTLQAASSTGGNGR